MGPRSKVSSACASSTYLVVQRVHVQGEFPPFVQRGRVHRKLKLQPLGDEGGDVLQNNDIYGTKKSSDENVWSHSDQGGDDASHSRRRQAGRVTINNPLSSSTCAHLRLEHARHVEDVGHVVHREDALGRHLAEESKLYASALRTRKRRGIIGGERGLLKLHHQPT